MSQKQAAAADAPVFKRYCLECDKGERLPSSSNAKMDFDYCTACKGIRQFGTERVAKAGAKK
jgi:hypothetical protein